MNPGGPFPTLVSVGTMPNIQQCKQVADYFGRPYYVTVPASTPSTAGQEASSYMCFVGGYRPQASGGGAVASAVVPTGSIGSSIGSRPTAHVPVEVPVLDDDKACKKLSLNLADGSKQLVSFCNSKSLKVMLPVDSPAAAPRQQQQQQQPANIKPSGKKLVGVLTLHSVLPDNHEVDPVYKAIPRKLLLYAGVTGGAGAGCGAADPWQIVNKHYYSTEMKSDGKAVPIPVHRGYSDCLRFGCERLRTGDVVEIRNVLGFHSIAYTAGITAHEGRAVGDSVHGP